MENVNRTEAIMSDATTLEPTSRYGFAPQTAFAATRACADRARELRAAQPADGEQSSTRSLLHRLVGRFAS